MENTWLLDDALLACKHACSFAANIILPWDYTREFCDELFEAAKKMNLCQEPVPPACGDAVIAFKRCGVMVVMRLL